MWGWLGLAALCWAQLCSAGHNRLDPVPAAPDGVRLVSDSQMASAGLICWSGLTKWWWLWCIMRTYVCLAWLKGAECRCIICTCVFVLTTGYLNSWLYDHLYKSYYWLYWNSQLRAISSITVFICIIFPWCIAGHTQFDWLYKSLAYEFFQGFMLTSCPVLIWHCNKCLLLCKLVWLLCIWFELKFSSDLYRAKRYPIKLESKSAIYNGSNCFYIYLETSWEKESWCRALRIASCIDSLNNLFLVCFWVV